MSRIKIEDYRGWEIYFDTDSEDFYTVSDYFDRQETKRSYASVKKYIDDFIKDNTLFKQVTVQCVGDMFSKSQFRKLVGIRKDGAFVFENPKGEREQFSKYGEDSYFLVDERNNPVFKTIEEIDSKIESLRREREMQCSKLIKFSMKDIRALYIK